MITIPLSTVVSHLQRKGVDLACLEGAPWFNDDGELGALLVTTPFIAIVYEPDQEKRAHTNVLYLGRDAVCSAAMGWATTVLGRSDDWIEDESGRVLLWHRGDRFWYHLWAWDNRSVPGPDITVIEGPTPPTPAARLRAVLEYEMGRP